MSILRTNNASEDSGNVDLFEKLEREASDDFFLLTKLGAHEFSTGNLLEMRVEAMGRLEELNRQRRLLRLLILATSGWGGALVSAFLLGYFWVKAVCIVGFVLTFAAMAYGLYITALKYRYKQSLQNSLQWIEQELVYRNLIM